MRGTWSAAASGLCWPHATVSRGRVGKQTLATCEVCVGESAIADRDTVALTVWLDTLTALVAENNELLKGKVVVDPTNPLKLDASGRCSSVGSNAARCLCRRMT